VDKETGKHVTMYTCVLVYVFTPAGAYDA